MIISWLVFNNQLFTNTGLLNILNKIMIVVEERGSWWLNRFRIYLFFFFKVEWGDSDKNVADHLRRDGVDDEFKW